MLQELRVKNFALVEDVSLEISSGFTVFTGETGAGKSLLLDAITLLLGAKANSDMVRKGSQSAEVEGVFVLEGENSRIDRLKESGFEVDKDDGFRLLVRREISSVENSRNRIWIQGKSATRAQLQNFLGDWVEVSGQHEFLKLNQEGYILKTLDQFGGLKPLRAQYQEIYSQWLQTTQQLQKSREAHQSKVARLDYLEFQIAELKKAGVDKDLVSREPELEFQKQKLSNAEKVKSFTSEVLSLLENSQDGNSVRDLLRQVQRHLAAFQLEDTLLNEIRGDYQSLEILFTQFCSNVEKLGDRYQLNEDDLESIDSQISAITRLKRKHSVDTLGLVNLLLGFEDELNLLEKSDELISSLEKLQNELKNKMGQVASQLTRERLAASLKLSNKWQESVRVLGIEKCQILFEFKQHSDFGPMGQDWVDVLFSANPGEKPKSLSKVASGGELSRLMLALKSLLANKSEIGVFLFDEIDSGIGGKAALRVAEKLRTLSEYNQVLVVSHLAPIAAAAKNHFRIQKKIEKSKTVTEIDFLSKDQRRHEIARMLGGIDTLSALHLADDLLANMNAVADSKTKVRTAKRVEAEL